MNDNRHILRRNQIHLRKIYAISAPCLSWENTAIMRRSNPNLLVDEYSSNATVSPDFESEKMIIAKENRLVEDTREEQIQVSSRGRIIKNKRPLDYEEL